MDDDQESIQGWLGRKGFSPNEEKRIFRDNCREVEFSFTELAAHTLNTFKQKAVARGWISAEEARK